MIFFNTPYVLSHCVFFVCHHAGKNKCWNYVGSWGRTWFDSFVLKIFTHLSFQGVWITFIQLQCVAQARVTTNPERWRQHCLGLLLMWKVSRVFHVCFFREVGRVPFGSTRCALKAEVRASGSSRTPKGLPPYALFPISRVSSSSLPTASRTLRRRRTRAHLTVL